MQWISSSPGDDAVRLSYIILWLLGLVCVVYLIKGKSQLWQTVTHPTFFYTYLHSGGQSRTQLKNVESLRQGSDMKNSIELWARNNMNVTRALEWFLVRWFPFCFVINSLAINIQHPTESLTHATALDWIRNQVVCISYQGQRQHEIRWLHDNARQLFKLLNRYSHCNLVKNEDSNEIERRRFH